MENLYIPATKSSPEIQFDADQCVLAITGESYPEDTAKFYTPVLNWVITCLKQLHEEQPMIVNVDISYFNSSSSKVLLDFFDVLDEAAMDGKQITVNWLYGTNNESAKEAGEDFQEDWEALAFHLICKEEKV